jgi:aminoglycoside phosphotransferase (APT) family kinase protein
LPRPINYLPELGVLICETIDGRPLSEFVRMSDIQVRGAMELLASLHASDVQPHSRRTSRGIVRSAQRKAALVAELAPQYAETLRALANSIEVHRPKDTELVPSHGDFSPRNILVTSDRFVLVDWDRLQLADPARDVVYFGISDWLPQLRRGRTPGRKLLEQAIEAYQKGRPGAALRKQLSFHIAAGLLRIACSLVELWPKEAYLVPALVSTAQRELK